MSDKQHAQLVLRTSDINTNESNIGVSNTTNSILLWKNINLRTVLGEMYNKYDLFNLSLKYVGSSKLNPVFLDIENSNIIVNINGLPFINQTYNQSHFCNTSNAVLGLYTIPNTVNSVSSQCFYNSDYLTFGKNQELVNINMFFTRIVDNEPPPISLANCTYPEFVFILDIFGIDKEEGNKNGMRL